MLRILLAALSILAGGVAAQSSEDQNVFGMNAVGRIDIGSGGFCTGALVAPDLVLTAAHCLFDKKTGTHIPTADMQFRLGLNAAQSKAKFDVLQAKAHPNYRPRRKGELTNMRHDLALLRLTQPVTSAQAAPLAIGYPDITALQTRLVSFGIARASQAEVQRGCQLHPHQDGILLTTCQAELGTSGAPVIQMRDGRPHIVSIVSAKALADQRPVALVVSVAEVFKTMTEAAGIAPLRVSAIQ